MSRWISGHQCVDTGNVRANKGEIVTFKFCMLNLNKPRKIFIVVKPDRDLDYYVPNGLEIVEQPRFAKNDFAVREAQTCIMKVRVNSTKHQLLEVFFVDESRNVDPRFVIAADGISFNDPLFKNTPLQPWDETDLCKEPYVKRN